MSHSISTVPFGQIDGREVKLWKLVNANGVELDITEYGGRLVRALVPDRDGKLGDVVLGYDTLEQYLADDTYQGALVGRYGNRIGKGTFSLGGKTYTLDCNNAPGGIPCALHGGPHGFSLRPWKAVPFETEDRVGLTLTIESPEGGEGYPGAVSVRVVSALSDDNVWHLGYKATVSRPTHLSLTAHPYWNLDGAFNGGDVFGHFLQVNADMFTPYDAGMIPVGEFRDVAGTPLDFRDAQTVGERVLNRDFDQLAFGNGYDMNWVLRGRTGDDLAFAATLSSPKTGRRLEVWTTEPGIQIYDGSYLPAGKPGKAGGKFAPNCGIALETQHFPDSPNKPMFPSTVYTPARPLYSTTEYRFRV